MISNPTNHKQISDLREEVASLESQLATSQAETAYWRKAYEEKTFDFSGANVTVNDLSPGVYAWDANGQLIGTPVVNPLNTDQLTLGMTTVYFTAYPDIKWCVDHLDGDYVYLGLYNVSEKVAFGSNASYAESTIASKCTVYLNNTIPNVASYLEFVTVNGVTNKVFIPSYKMFSGSTGSGGADANDPTFEYLSASADNRKACIANWNGFSYFWLSSPSNTTRYVWSVYMGGSFHYGDNPSNIFGFRPEVKVRYK